MATIEKRMRGDSDGETTFRVKWRFNGLFQSASWDDYDSADRCKKLVEGHDHKIDRDTVMRRMVGAPETPLVERMTLNQWFERWCNQKSGVEPGTMDGYKAHYENRIRNADVEGTPLGSYLLTDITREVVALWVKNLPTYTRHIVPVTVHRHHATLHQILQAAADDGHIPKNPARKTALPRDDEDKEHENKDPMFLTHFESADLVDSTPEGLPRDVVVTLLGTGLRWGELTALRKMDVITRDPDSRSKSKIPTAFFIRRAWKQSKERGPYVGAPKSKRSKRKVTLPNKVAAVVAERMKDLPAAALLFSWDGVNRLVGKDFRNDYLRSAVKLAGIDESLSWHDFRHTHASWLIANNVPLLAIQRRLGHESISTTVDTYGHLIPDLDDVLLNGLDAVLP